MNMIINIYKKTFVHRYDDNGYVKYLSADDFDGLCHEEFSFKSDGNTLFGNFYYRNITHPDALVIFCHGIGGGHRSYMTEINEICSHGYKVMAYDNTGCFRSEGDSIKCLSQSLADLDNALKYLKSSGIFAQFKHVYVVGHSWGGYAAGNIANYHSDIAKIVVISGFTSVKTMICDFLKSNKVPFRKFAEKRIFDFERKSNPLYVSSSSLDAINGKKSEFMLIHSTDDPTVAFNTNTGYIRQNTTNKDVKFLVCTNKAHNPNYTSDASSYLNEKFGAFNAALKAKKLKSLAEKQEFFADTDWRRMTRQDETVWNEIFAFLDK